MDFMNDLVIEKAAHDSVTLDDCGNADLQSGTAVDGNLHAWAGGGSASGGYGVVGFCELAGQDGAYAPESEKGNVGHFVGRLCAKVPTALKL